MSSAAALRHLPLRDEDPAADVLPADAARIPEAPADVRQALLGEDDVRELATSELERGIALLDRRDAGGEREGHLVAERIEGIAQVGGESVELAAGQVIVFTRGDRHIMSSEPQMRVEDWPCGANDALPEQLPFAAAFGKEGPITAKVVCGFLACDSRPFNPLLENLPPVLVADSSEGAGLPSLRDLVCLAIEEASGKRAGGRDVLGRLTELMFIEVVRQHLERLPDGCDLVYAYDTKAERTGITSLLRDLADTGIRFRDLETKQSSLEEIFVSLVRESR